MRKLATAIGIYGTTQDARDRGGGETQRWRPTLDLCTQPEFRVDRLELLHSKRYANPAKALAAEIERESPHGTQVRLHEVRSAPFDYVKALRSLGAFAEAYGRDPGWNLDGEDYFVHLTVGSIFHQTALFLLVQSHEIPGRLVFTRPPTDERRHPASIVDLEDERFAILDPRRRLEAEVEAEALLKGAVETRSPTFNAMVHEIRTVAQSSTDPILLTGETGVGKTFIAKHIHELRRRGRPPLVNERFVEVNCATLRGTLVQSTIFGHAKGAFTGALQEHDGVLKAADGGLLFLDEIGELDMDTQAMLLKALEEKEFTPLGTTKPVRSDFQLVAATNCDLLREIESGRFRSDLYARIAYWAWEVPPLRRRPEDIEALVDQFLADWARERGRARVRFATRARSQFLSFAASPAGAWTWNLRDLIRAVRRIAALASRGTITETIVRVEIERLRAEWSRVPPPGGQPTTDHFARDEELVRRHLAPARVQELQGIDIPQIAHAIRICRQSATQAAAGRLLFARGNRSDRVRKFLERVGLRFEDLRREPTVGSAPT